MSGIEIALRQTFPPDQEEQQGCRRNDPRRRRQGQGKVRAAEGVDGKIAQDPAAGEKRAVEGEGKGKDRREMGHGKNRPPHPRRPQDVEKDPGDEPRHQRRIFHRIPAPIAAPAQHLIRPIAANEDPRPQKAPCGKAPPPRVLQPRRVLGPIKERPDTVTEGNR